MISAMSEYAVHVIFTMSELYSAYNLHHVWL